MKLFQMQVHRGRKDACLVLAHFPSREEAIDHVEATFSGWQIRNLVEITQKALFQIAELEPE